MIKNSDISIICPMYIVDDTHINQLNLCLESLKKVNHIKKTELILVNDCSPIGKDRIKTLIKTHFKYRIKILNLNENVGPGLARNHGASCSASKILVFIDHDCVVSKDWLEKLVYPILKKTTKVTTSCYFSPVQSSILFNYQNYDYMFRMPKSFGKVNFVNGCSLAIDNNLFSQLGGFPSMRISEDTIFGSQLCQSGNYPIFVPDANVKHHYKSKIYKYLHQRFLFSSSLVYLKWKSIFKLNDNNLMFNPVQNDSADVVQSFSPLSILLSSLSAFLFVFFLLFFNYESFFHICINIILFFIWFNFKKKFFKFIRFYKPPIVNLFSYILLTLLVDMIYFFAMIYGTLKFLYFYKSIFYKFNLNK